MLLDIIFSVLLLLVPVLFIIGGIVVEFKEEEK